MKIYRPKYCECGCNQEVKPGKRFVYCHHSCKKPWKQKSNPQPCQCGCGQMTNEGDGICQICYRQIVIYPDMGKAIHHIDYDKNNCKEDNLIFLCENCHNKTSQKSKRKEWSIILMKKILEFNSRKGVRPNEREFLSFAFA